MDSFELNKFAAGIIIALLVGMIASLLAKSIVDPVFLEKNVLEVAVSEEAPAAGGDVKKEAEPIEALLAAANLENGAKLAKQTCAQCHTFESGGANKIGPNLWDVVGHKAAQRDGFAYSSAFKSQTFEWGYDTLNKFLFRPRDFVPGTKMSFVGLAKAQDRADVIAYLRTLSASPVPLP